LADSSERKTETVSQDPSEPVRATRRFVPSYVAVIFLLALSAGILSLLTREIALTFFGPFADEAAARVAIGMTTQLSTTVNAAQLVTGLAMSVLIIRFRPKLFLMAGLLLSFVSAVGNFLAPSIMWMHVFFALSGISIYMVGISGITLIGEFVPSSRKAKAVSYVGSATYVSMLVGAIVIPQLADLGSWRFVYLFLTVPSTLAALAIAFIGIPFLSRAREKPTEKQAYIHRYKQVLFHRSSAAVLIAGLFFSGLIGVYALNFIRQQFFSDIALAVQRQYSSYIFMVSTTLYVIGGLVAGRLVGKISAKTLAAVGALGDGIFTALLFLSPSLPVALAFDWLHVWFTATAGMALTCVALDQVPEARGTMMSLKSVFGEFGNIIAPLLGLFMLASYSYAGVGIVFGVMSMIASAIIFFLVRDPAQTFVEQKKEKP